ncbi:MgtC/SapB family protein [Erwinia tracheiphila]|uniref:Protein MgtC n=1 Tax=Erwinia tracheiphila TaxID=65700 RepID=A0A0M2KB60_9GAMM|nr:MgtC/SapB family protein [Erwinia tracheiphila]KKF34251.1 transporter [Erwinia tracheiphila]UIA89280.1 MgtC/SapB family protein [Erwinia tracheiphila]UIA97663.1 MgtC/SapB family protein [Erwinia tracheiphila]
MEQYFYTLFSFSEFWNAILKFSASFILGAIIGWERESKNKPVGIKTCIIISVASCLLTQVSIQSAEYYAEMSSNIRTDPMRLAAQVISGVGFLGAGVIMHKEGDGISGLTTAAMVWASAGVGIACGSTFYLYALMGTVLFLFAIRFSSALARFRLTDGHIHRASVHLVILDRNTIPLVFSIMHDKSCYIDNLNIIDGKKEKIIMNMRLSTRKKLTVFSLYSTLKDIDGVYSVALDR